MSMSDDCLHFETVAKPDGSQLLVTVPWELAAGQAFLWIPAIIWCKKKLVWHDMITVTFVTQFEYAAMR